MLFNSLDFAVFLPVVFVLFWFVFGNSIKNQNFLIVIASYFFYGLWDWRFMSLIFASTTIDYFIAKQLNKQNSNQVRKQLLWLSLGVNLGVLGFFKYCNFFLENFINAFSFLGTSLSPFSLKIILPVGISFYTFQTLSYTIDVYRKKINPTNDFIAFAAFVSFFPQLVAGPIERATNLLPQFSKQRIFNYHKAVNGLRQILWGLFKKIVIADSCAEYVNYYFEVPSLHMGSDLYLGVLFFAFQIYGDFSGYSDIAIGTSKLFGFDLMKNFNYPYFSRDIAEFWRRWHISLSTWFRDYLYIPLGGSRVNMLLKIRNVFVIFLVSGFWHGANWTFIVWGGLHALFFLPLLLANKNRNNVKTIVAINKKIPSLKDFFKIVITFNLSLLAWVFFRAKNLNNAFDYLSHLFSESFFSIPKNLPKRLIFMLTIFIVLEWIGRREDCAINFVKKWPVKFQYIGYYVLILSIFWFAGKEQQFIYFQF